jgi:glycosyltransferase involved in cell wall biosynthesis
MINLLASFGHHINAYIVPKDKLRDKSELEIRDFIRRHFTDLDGFIFKWTGDTPMTQADAVADATIVTHWTTAYLVDPFTNAAKVFYFVQDWEPFFFPMGTSYLRAEQTYKMGFSCITLGRWLTEHLRSLYSADADYFDFAVDHTIYYPRAEKNSTSPRVCFYARPSTPRRLFPLGIAALEIVAQQRPDVEIVLYGAEEEDLAGYHIPFSYTNLGILTQDELAELFSSSDIGIVFSSTNCSLVPPEMMACRCAIVDLNRETVRGILAHEVNALLAEPTPEAVAEAIMRLLDDEALRQRLIEAAHQQIQDLSWVHSARMVEKILYKKLPRRGRVKRQRQAIAPLPAFADFPEDQRKHLNAIHATRQLWRDKMQATIKTWGKRLLNVDGGVFLNGKPVRVLGELTGKQRVGQCFIARQNNLYRIDVLVATYRRRNTRDVILHLRTSPTAVQDLATVRVNACLFTDYHYASFTFDPQPTSRGKTYYFEIESPESIPGDAVTLWIYKDVDLPEAKLYKNEQPSHGQIIFGLHYTDDHAGEIEEQPLLHEWWRLTATWQRLEKAYQVFTTRGIQGLIQETVNYWKWKMGRT